MSGIEMEAGADDLDRRSEHADGAPRLLVIDDDLVQRTIISKVAQQVGYEAEAASSFEEAARILQKEAYDCITLDLSLGEHSGTQLLRTIAKVGLRESL